MLESKFKNEFFYYKIIGIGVFLLGQLFVLPRFALVLLCSLALAGCDVIAQRLQSVGRVPEFTKVNTYEMDMREEAMRASIISEEMTSGRQVPSNSLWKQGFKTFLRPRSAGDIIKVKISIQDQAQLNNQTTKGRQSTEKGGVANLFGLENKIPLLLPGQVNPANLLNMNNNDQMTGNGQINRRETITTTVAAAVIRVLPSGNLLIKGSQEIRVNYEIREVSVEGIVRPEDISNDDNSVNLDQVAEARISYGGRGQISEYQQDKYGKQVIDAISPF